jgi:hypothetical protein
MHTSIDQTPKLRFSYPFDERTAVEAEDRGYWGHSFVELPNGETRPVVFYDATRIAQDLKEETVQGRPFIAERGLIVLEAVTLHNMSKAVERLAGEGFFS